MKTKVKSIIIATLCAVGLVGTSIAADVKASPSVTINEAKSVKPSKVKYLDWDANQKKLVEKTVLESEYELVTDGMATLAEGKYKIEQSS